MTETIKINDWTCWVFPSGIRAASPNGHGLVNLMSYSSFGLAVSGATGTLQAPRAVVDWLLEEQPALAEIANKCEHVITSEGGYVFCSRCNRVPGPPDMAETMSQDAPPPELQPRLCGFACRGGKPCMMPSGHDGTCANWDVNL